MILRITSVITRPMIGSAIGEAERDDDRAGDDAERDEAVDPGVVAVGDQRRARRAGCPARSRTCAAISLPTKPITPAAASTQRCVSVCGMDEAHDRLVERDAGADEDRERRRRARRASRRGTCAGRTRSRAGRGQRVAEVVDQVGEQRDRARERKIATCAPAVSGEHGEAERDRLDARAGPDDRAVDEPVGVAVTAVVAIMIAVAVVATGVWRS